MATGKSTTVGTGKRTTGRIFLSLAAALAAWICLYGLLPVGVDYLTLHVLRLSPQSRLGFCAGFFLYQAPKMLLVLVLVIFVAGVIRSFVGVEQIPGRLAARGEFGGCVLASLIGVITPFCNCSAIPLFIAFVEAGVPLGVTFAFLIASPMVNEVALAMLFSAFGGTVAALYAASGVAIAITAGCLIPKLGMERFVEGWVSDLRTSQAASPGSTTTLEDRILYGLRAVRETAGKVWPYVVVGSAVGAVITAYAPEQLMAGFASKRVWWSVPAAILVGAPMYSSPAGVIPIVQALMEKGASLGTALAFMMSVIGLSLPQVIILRKVLKPRLIGVFVGTVAFGILIVGLLFNAFS
jgi:uncharacterized protein